MITTSQPVGTLLREWRQRRRLTQLDLAPVFALDLFFPADAATAAAVRNKAP